MGYFNNLDDESLQKYKKILKIEKKLIDVFFYFYIDDHSNFMQFHYHLLVHQRSSNFHIIYNGFNLMIFDGLSNDNEIA
jgi:hypothetical protein